MTLLHPLLLFAGLGIALPILAHLLNRYEVKRTDWAAMRFLNRSVRVRSRQIRLRDLFLLLLRCLALLTLVLALSRPTVKSGGIAARLGERRAGVIIALDASYSMQHSDGGVTRFERAIEKVETIMATVVPGDPVCLVLLGDEHRVVVRNAAFEPGSFSQTLHAQRVRPESMDLNSVPRRLRELAREMDAPQKEVYIVTDAQERHWRDRSVFSRDALRALAESASVFIVPVQGGSDNLAMTDLELVSGVLRKGTVARYRATVRNCGAGSATGVRVTGLLDNISVDTKVIPSIAPGASETVSLSVPFRNAGAARIAARLENDSLPVDDSRRAVAVIRERVAVLCVEESAAGAGEFIASALRARGNDAGEEDFTVRSVPWVALPTEDLSKFDVVVVADVPDITPDQARLLDGYVRSGNGLIWFGGDNMKAASWNERSTLAGTPLLPAVIDQPVSTSDAMGVGRSLDPMMPDHPVCRPLFSLPEDLLSEARFLKLLSVKPASASFTVLSLAGSASPVLLEHSIGRGHVFMFTTSAEPVWNNMALTPVFPMLLQQMVTYLTAREFERPRLVGESLSLSYVDQPDASDAVFDTPSDETVVVPVREDRSQYVALFENADEAGFYLARASVQSPGMPIAVNVDTLESDVRCIPLPELVSSFDDTDVTVIQSDADLLDEVDRTRTTQAFWRFFLVVGLSLLVVESLLADRLLSKQSRPSDAGHAATRTSEA